VIEQGKLNERSLRIGERIVSRLQQMKARSDISAIGDIRHLGGMVAFDLVKTRAGNESTPMQQKPSPRDSGERADHSFLRHPWQQHPHHGATHRNGRRARRGPRHYREIACRDRTRDPSAEGSRSGGGGNVSSSSYARRFRTGARDG